MKNKDKWRSRKKSSSAIKESGKQIIKSNEVAKNDFNIDRSGMLLEKQKETFNGLVKETALEFSDIKDKIDPNSFVFMYITLVKVIQNIFKIIKCQWNYLKI